MTDIERLISLPRLQSDEWAGFIKKTNLKKQDIARMLAIEPESLSRILKGKPCSIAAEKLFRMIMVCELTREDRDNIAHKFGAMIAICSLGLSSVELVQ